MFSPPGNVSDYPEISLLKRRFSCFCADFTAKPTVFDAITEDLSLNKRKSKEIVELYYEDMMAILNDDDQVKPSFRNFDLLGSSQRSGCDQKSENPIIARFEVAFCQNQ
jgi:nucleoid DNA-binding protein